MASNLFTEIVYGTVANRGTIIPLTEVSAYIQKAQREQQELYASYYTFDDGVVEHLKKAKTVKGFKGQCHLRQILLDIDKGKDTDEFVLQRTRVFAQQLLND